LDCGGAEWCTRSDRLVRGGWSPPIAVVETPPGAALNRQNAGHTDRPARVIWTSTGVSARCRPCPDPTAAQIWRRAEPPSSSPARRAGPAEDEDATTPGGGPAPGVVARTGAALESARSPGSRWRPADPRGEAHPTTDLPNAASGNVCPVGLKWLVAATGSGSRLASNRLIPEQTAGVACPRDQASNPTQNATRCWPCRRLGAGRDSDCHGDH
jgi:hypothetical protein